MNPMTKAVAVALVHVLLISTLGAKLLYDRRTRPQAWFKTQRWDPNLPIRGRYVSLQLEVKDPRSAEEIAKKFSGELQIWQNAKAKNGWHGQYSFGRECGSIAMRDGVPVAVFENSGIPGVCRNLAFIRSLRESPNDSVLRLEEPVLFFIPDTAQDPSRVRTGEEVWVLATIPKKGPPRAIELGVKSAIGGEIGPLGVR